jgi:O-antigen/teichoic acid export membrane protein
MGLAFVPLYIKYMGIEAYGLIGLFALLQAWLSLVDMGITPTIGREMARFTGGNYCAQSIRDLLRSIEIIALCIALVIATVVALGSDWIASHWLQVGALSIEVVAEALVIMGVVAALRFVEGIYRSSMIGLQRQVLFNVLISIMAIFRWAGAVGVLVWVSPDIEAFFVWQGIVSIATVCILAAGTYTILPKTERGGRFSYEAMRSVWRFAAGMLGITFLGLLLTQVDKILLSKLLSLSEYGYYSLAAVVAGALYIVITPITQAWYPRLCELHTRGEKAALVKTYHEGAQLVSVIPGSAAIVVIFFSETILRLWTQDPELAERVAPLLRLLMLGTLLNGLMWIPYQTQLAYGWTSLSVYNNIVAVAIIVPAILWATPRYGAEGAAWVWVTLNTGYLMIGIHFMYRRILSQEKWRWYLQDLLSPLSAATLTAAALVAIWPASEGNFADFTLLTIAALSTLLAALFAANRARQQLRHWLTPYWIKWTNACAQ